PLADIAEVVNKAVETARALVSKDYAAANKCLAEVDLGEAERGIAGALAIAYPMGLPEWEPARTILDGREEIEGTAASKEVIEEADAALWWAGRCLAPPDAMLSEFFGRNEKTKVIVKLQRGAPVRESPFDERTQKELMAYYYKKQEEHKKLMEDDDETHVNAPWANPRSLKAAFNGVANPNWRPT
ncbi:hypothetical protein HK405_014999, partial [Cladochytrium tenue]